MAYVAQLLVVGLYWSLAMFLKGTRSQTGNLIDKIPLPWETRTNISLTPGPDPMGDTIDVVDQSMVRTVTDQVNTIESNNQLIVQDTISMAGPENQSSVSTAPDQINMIEFNNQLIERPVQVNMAEPHDRSTSRTGHNRINMVESPNQSNTQEKSLHINKHTITEGINRHNEGKSRQFSKLEINTTPLRNAMNDAVSKVTGNRHINKLNIDNSDTPLTSNIGNAASTRSNQNQNGHTAKPIIGAFGLHMKTGNVDVSRPQQNRKIAEPVRNSNTELSDKNSGIVDLNFGHKDLLRVTNGGSIENQNVHVPNMGAADVLTTMRNMDTNLQNQNFGVVGSVNVKKMETFVHPMKNVQTQVAGVDHTTQNRNENLQSSIVESINFATTWRPNNQIKLIQKSSVQPVVLNRVPEPAARNQHFDNVGKQRLGTTSALLQNIDPISTPRNMLNPHKGISERIFSDFNKKFSSPFNKVTNVPNIDDGHFNFKTNFSHSHESGHSTNFNMTWDADKLHLQSANTSFTRGKQAQHKTMKTSRNVTTVSNKSEQLENKETNARIHKNANKIKVSNKQDLKGFDTIERTGKVLSDGLSSVVSHNTTKHTHAQDQLELNNFNGGASSFIHQLEQQRGLPLDGSGGIVADLKLHETKRIPNTEFSSNLDITNGILDNSSQTQSLMKSKTGIPFPAQSSDKSFLMQAITNSAPNAGSQQILHQGRSTLSNNKWNKGSSGASDFPTNKNIFQGQKNNHNFHFQWNTNSNSGHVNKAKSQPIVHKSTTNSINQRKPGNFQSSWQKSWWTSN